MSVSASDRVCRFKSFRWTDLMCLDSVTMADITNISNIIAVSYTYECRKSVMNVFLVSSTEHENDGGGLVTINTPVYRSNSV